MMRRQGPVPLPLVPEDQMAEPLWYTTKLPSVCMTALHTPFGESKLETPFEYSTPVFESAVAAMPFWLMVMI